MTLFAEKPLDFGDVFLQIVGGLTVSLSIIFTLKCLWNYMAEQTVTHLDSMPLFIQRLFGYTSTAEIEQKGQAFYNKMENVVSQYDKLLGTLEQEKCKVLDANPDMQSPLFEFKETPEGVGAHSGRKRDKMNFNRNRVNRTYGKKLHFISQQIAELREEKWNTEKIIFQTQKEELEIKSKCAEHDGKCYVQSLNNSTNARYTPIGYDFRGLTNNVSKRNTRINVRTV